MVSTIRSDLFIIQFFFLGAFCALLSLPANAYLIRIGKDMVLKANPDKGIIEVHALSQTTQEHHIIQIEPLQESDFNTSGVNGIIFSPSNNINAVVLSSDSGHVLLEVLDRSTESTTPDFGFRNLLTNMSENQVPMLSRTPFSEYGHDFPAFNISNALSDREFVNAYSRVLSQQSSTVVRVPNYPPAIERYYLDSAEERAERRIYQMQINCTTLHYRTYSAQPNLFNDIMFHRINNYVPIRISYLAHEEVKVLYDNRTHSKDKTSILKSFKNLFARSEKNYVLQNKPSDHDEPVVPFSGYIAKSYLKTITESCLKLCFLLLQTSRTVPAP